MQHSTWIFYFLFFSSLFGQDDSLRLLELPDIEVLFEMRSLSDSGQYIELGSYPAQKLSDILSQESNIYVKSYSPSGLASVSARGGSAAHTLLLWEGIPLNNPMLGQSDLSLFPLFFLQSLRYEEGASAAVFGSSSLGGALQLNTRMSANSPLGFSALALMRYQSTGNLSQGLGLAYKAKRWKSSLRYWHEDARHAYRFRNSQAFGSEKPIERAAYASQRQRALLWNQELRLGGGFGRVSTQVFLQNNQRLLQPSLLQAYQGEEQRDASLRAQLVYESEQALSIRFAYIEELLHFWSRAIDAPNRSRSLFFDYEQHKSYEHFALHWGFRQSMQLGLSRNYMQGKARQDISALFFQARRQRQQTAYSFSLHQAYSYESFIPLPSIVLEGKWLLGPSEQSLKLSQQYRLASLNDRFWQPGGRADLRPEYSLGLAWGQNWQFAQKLKLRIEAFAYRVQNWILWSPDMRTGLWSPENIALVWSRGIDASVEKTWVWGDWQVRALLSWQYLFTTDKSGLQLIYTPRHQGRGQLFLGYKGFSLRYTEQYLGWRAVQVDHSLKLPGHQVGNLGLAYSKKGYSIQLSIENIWNSDYALMQLRPMPLRFWSLGLELGF